MAQAAGHAESESMEHFWPSFLGASLFRIPTLLIFLVAFVLAVVRSPELGKAAWTATLGFGALAVSSAIGLGMLYLPMAAVAHHTPVRDIAQSLAVLGLGGSITEMAGAILIAVAVFQKAERRVIATPFQAAR